MILHVIGIDPGTLAGVAHLVVTDGKPTILTLNTLTLGASAMQNAIRIEIISVRANSATLGFETVGGIEIPFVPRVGHGGDPITQGRHVGQIEYAFAAVGIELMTINPATAKLALTGHGRAGVKAQLGDRPGDARKRGKANMVRFAMNVEGWAQASLAIPSELSHLQAAADAVGIALAAWGKWREAEMKARVR